MEHLLKQKKNCQSAQKLSATLKINNITFNREYTKSIDQQLLKFHMRMGKNVSHKAFLPQNKISSKDTKQNKENSIQYQYLSQKLQQSNLKPLILLTKKQRTKLLINNQSKSKLQQSIASNMFLVKAVNLKSTPNLLGSISIVQSQSQYFKPIIDKTCKQKSLKLNFLKAQPDLKLQRLKNKKAKTSNTTNQQIARDKRKSSAENIIRKSRAQTEKHQSQNIFPQKKLTLMSSKAEIVFERKFRQYCKFLQEKGKLHRLQLKFQSNYPEDIPKFVIGKGNNAKIVRQVFKKRWWWKKYQQEKNPTKIYPDHRQNVNFIWTQTKVINFYSESCNTGKPTLHNHFEINNCLGNKKELFMNMKNYYQTNNKNAFQYLPLTFHVKNTRDKAFKQFQEEYHKNQQGQLNNDQMWILKPGENSNRGRGITVHKNFQQIKNLIQSYFIQDQNVVSQNVRQTQSQNMQKKINNSKCSNVQSQDGQSSMEQEKQPSHTHIIQKYIERPFLYQKRKFDIRCFYLLVNINKTIKAYWYKDGYIRTSSFEFSTQNSNLEAQSSQKSIFVHLTNDAIQKNCQDYGKYEEGNKIQFSTFKKYLAGLKPPKKKPQYNFDEQIYSNMKKIATDSIHSTYRKLRVKDRQQSPCFELFGLDFMIDENFKPWLIQVNTNPCLETSCLILERLIPKLLDDSFQLSLDLLYPPPLNWANSKKHLAPSHQYNRFELIFDQDKFEEQKIQTKLLNSN